MPRFSGDLRVNGSKKAQNQLNQECGFYTCAKNTQSNGFLVKFLCVLSCLEHFEFYESFG
jgi:hypothetical protein